VKDAGEYLAYIKALIIANPRVADWKTIREESQGDLGLFRLAGRGRKVVETMG